SNGLAITNNSIRYIGVELNDPNDPQVVVRTTYNWNFNTDFPLGTVVNEGGTLHVQNAPWEVGDHASAMIQRTRGTAPIARDKEVGGIIFSESGTRRVVVSAGQLWRGLTAFVIAALDTDPGGGADTFDGYSSQGKEDTGIAQWPNTLYDNGSGGTGSLQTMGNNKWANLWWYIELDTELVMVYGTAQYNTRAEAENEDIPSTLPDRLQVHGVLAARFIFQESAATSAEILSAFDTPFTPSGVTLHADLGTVTSDQHHAQSHALLSHSTVPEISDVVSFVSAVDVLTISSGVIQLPAAPFGLIEITGQGGVDDDLTDVEINGGGTTLVPGTMIYLTNTAGDAITVKHSANMILSLGVDVILNSTDKDWICLHAITTDIWLEYDRSPSLMTLEQYALLAGRSGGQTLIGGTAANEDLLLQATAHATKTTSIVTLSVDGTRAAGNHSWMELGIDAQTFGAAIKTVKFLTGTSVDFTNALDGKIVRFSDTSVGGPFVEFATGELQVNEDIDISGHIAIGTSASVDTKAGAVLSLSETSTATASRMTDAGNIDQLRIVHTYTPTSISSSAFRGLRMDVVAGGDEDIDGVFLAGATALNFLTQHDSEGDINSLIGAAGQTIMGNNPLDNASSKTPQFGAAFAQGIGLQGAFIYSANDAYAGASFDIFPDAFPLGMKAVDALLVLRSLHDSGRTVTAGAESSGVSVVVNTDNHVTGGTKTNRITITDLVGVRIAHVDTASSATIATGKMLKVGAWSSQPTYTNGPYGISQEGVGDVNWLAGYTYVGGASIPSLATANNAALTVDQDASGGAIPVLTLDQADVSEEMMEFITTIGVGNAIEAIGGKSLTTTHFIKVTIPGGLTRYFPVGTIA
ncbi:hypothetical protein LCGC14_1672300, partial [marine sediment metagenome]